MPLATLSTHTSVNALLYGTRWEGQLATTNLSFSFPVSASTWSTYGTPAEPNQGFEPLNVNQQQFVRDALAAWAAVANLQWTEVPDAAAGSGQIRVAMTSWQMGAQQ